jgi:signal transduction histidine kinase
VLSPDALVCINRAMLVASVVRGTVHTVNNILQTIGGQAEMLGQRPEVATDVVRRAERIVAQTGRAAAYMRELSALGREVPGAPDRSDVRGCVDRAYALREYDLQRERVAFDVRTEGDVPPARIDQPALSMILLNLFLNAEQVLRGAADARIQVVLAAGDGGVLVSVRDNGPGVAADIRARVFDAFFTTGAASTSLGLGLTVARHLAQQHNGVITLVDEPGTQGARFDVVVPAVG